MTDNNSAPELLPCPFCGAKNPKVHLVEATGEVHSVECKTCFAECDDVAAWNTRAPADLCAADRGVTYDNWRERDLETIAALQPTDAQPVVKRICPNCDGYGDIRCEQCRGQSYVAATPPTDNTALVDDIDLQCWAAFKCHALPSAIARLIAEKVNERAALASREAPPAVMVQKAGKS